MPVFSKITIIYTMAMAYEEKKNLAGESFPTMYAMGAMYVCVGEIRPEEREPISEKSELNGARSRTGTGMVGAGLMQVSSLFFSFLIPSSFTVRNSNWPRLSVS